MSSTAVGAVGAKPAPATFVGRLFSSTIGQKLIMAATGVGLSLFVLGHMSGNLLAFQGPEALDAYGAALRKFPAALWGARIGLLVAIALHIWAYLALTVRSNTARPEGYRVAAYRESTLASRTMRWSGPLLLAFIIFHLLDLTIGTVNPGFVHGEVYRNLKASMARPAVAAFYLVALASLALHLHHGIWSMFQTVGASQPRYDSIGRKLATIFTIVVVGGFAAVPVAFLLGLLN